MVRFLVRALENKLINLVINKPKTCWPVYLETKEMIQEDSKLIAPKKAKGDSLLAKRKQKTSCWSFKSLLFCCSEIDDKSVRNEAKSFKKTTNSTIGYTTHYTNDSPTSFFRSTFKHRDTNAQTLLTNSTIVFPKESAFVLRKGAKRIITNISLYDFANKSSTNSRRKPKNQSIFKNSTQNNSIFSAELNEASRGYDFKSFKRHEIFALYHSGITVDKDDWREITPEFIAQHIATKLKGKFIIDALCGYGGNTIQFANHSPCVIGVESDPYKLKKAKHNASVYNVENSIEFINANFFSLAKLRADVVFLAPSVQSIDQTDRFSVFKHLSPNLPDLIRHSLKFARSLCIQLPPCTNIEDLAEIFSDIYNESPQEYDKLNYTLQIDMLFVEENPVCTVAYFGGDNKIGDKEHRDLIYEMINAVEKPGWKNGYTENFVFRLLDYIGLYRSLSLFSIVEEEMASTRNSSSVFEAFLNLLFEKKLLTKEVLINLQNEKPDQIFQFEGSYKHLKLNSPYKPTSTKNDKESASQHLYDFGSYGKNRNTSEESSAQDSNNFVPREFFNSNEIDKADGHLHDESPNSPVRMPINSQNHNEFREVSEVSIDTSEMAVSNYSMKSAALLDSYSEACGGYELSLDGDISDSGGKKKPPKKSQKISCLSKRDKSSLLDQSSDRSGSMNEKSVSQGNKTFRSSKFSSGILLKNT